MLNIMVNITEMEEDGSVKENYEIENSEEAWNTFVESVKGH